MSDPIVRPVVDQRCAFITGLDPAGKSRRCIRDANLSIDGKPLCDQHAEIAMAAACGRNVQIQRVSCG